MEGLSQGGEPIHMGMNCYSGEVVLTTGAGSQALQGSTEGVIQNDQPSSATIIDTVVIYKYPLPDF